MEKAESCTIAERNALHEALMVSILRKCTDTPLVLKGGTALYLGYGLSRFSEDLDFDSSKNINLMNKIRDVFVPNLRIESIDLKKNTETVSRYIVRYIQQDTGRKDSLKIEISYRTPVPPEQVIIKNGIKFASIDRIIDNKLKAAFDGESTRVKGRDLFDLWFISKNYPDWFTHESLLRLQKFAEDANKLLVLYEQDIKQDVLLSSITDTESLILELQDSVISISDLINDSEFDTFCP